MAERWTQSKIAALAAEERAELAVPARRRMDPYALAEHHGLDCYSIDEMTEHGCDDAVVQHFMVTRQTVWSAALVPLGSARVILENPAHTEQRRRVSVAHELGHFLLEHDFSQVLLTADGCRQFEPKLEKQADYFCWQLMLPQDDAVWAGFQDLSDTEIADLFDVSEQWARWRMGGPRTIVRNTRNRRGRPTSTR